MIAVLLDHLWQSSVFAMAIFALTLVLKNNSAQSRYCLWLAASIKFLLPFSVLVAVGEYMFASMAAPVYAPESMETIRLAALPFVSSNPQIAHPSATGLDWLSILLATWALGVMAVVLAWIIRWQRIARAVRQATPLQIKAPLPILASSSFVEPGLVGIRKPVLLLPEGIADKLSEKELNAIIAHELCHLRRRDNFTAALHVLVQALFWFHPLVWWLGVKLIAERERACDESVLAAGNDPRIYAEGILKVCKHQVQSSFACAAGISGADLKKRLETIMVHRGTARLTMRKKFLLSASALAALLVPIAIGAITASANAQTALPSLEEFERLRDEQRFPRVAIPFAPQKFDKYVGYYEANYLFTVTREGDRFFTRLTTGAEDTRLTREPKNEIYPESENKFFAKSAASQYSFVTDAFGRVTGLIYHHRGMERHFKRIDESTVRNIRTALMQRIKNNKQSPGTEAALRRYLVSLEMGQPNYSEMAPHLASMIRTGRARYVSLRKKWGALETVTFKGVSSDGMDVYTVKFKNVRTEWAIPPLTADEKLMNIDYAVVPEDGA